MKLKKCFGGLFTKKNIYATMLTGGRKDGTYIKITT
jgi:hypothetical protein